MDKITITLNDFLYNSGVLGFYKILEHSEKEHYVQVNANMLIVDTEAFKNFEDDYINTMLYTYEETTRWYSIVGQKANIEKIEVESKEGKTKLNDYYKTIKKAFDSASYKAGYEIVKQNAQENPYELLQAVSKSKDDVANKEYLLKVIKHLEDNKETYCMKDIIYNKINCFWENVAFLNRQANKNNIKEEYRKAFVLPIMQYIEQTRNSELTCIECGNSINKSEANGMSWLKDVGVDMNRKKSGFWDFREDAFLCPICNLIYSCVPLGFCMIGNNGIFVNNNESFKMLKSVNKLTKAEELMDDGINGIYHKVITNYINKISQSTNDKFAKFEPKNIQVIKRVGTKDNEKYEFNMISKEKLNILKNTIKYFECLMPTDAYQKALNNLLYGIKQYRLMDEMLNDKYEINYMKYVLFIELNSIGGIELETRKKMLDEMITAGEELQKNFFIKKENNNKLEAYKYRLQNALKANNVEEFMKYFTMFYGGLGKPMPRGEAMKELISNTECFRLFGYAYMYGLGKLHDKKEEIQGGNNNEE